MKTTPTGTPILSPEKICEALNKTLESPYGLLLLGITGSGKTTLFNNWIKDLKEKSKITEIPISITSREIVSNYESYGEKYFTSQENHDSIYFALKGRRPIFIDDLGSEKALNYGRGVILDRVINEILDKGGKIYANSNYNIPQLTEIYGERTTSRLKGNCAIVVIDNPDFREIKQVQILKDLIF